MSQKNPPSKEGGSSYKTYPKTRMRTPFTAEVPGEFNTKEGAAWVPDLTSFPDASDEECPARDPLAILPGSKGRSDE